MKQRLLFNVDKSLFNLYNIIRRNNEVIVIKLDVLALLNNEGSTINIDTPIDVLCDYFSNQSISFEKDIHLKGSISNIRGVLVLNAKVSGVYNALCDRCLKTVTKAFEFDINESFIQDNGEENSEHEILFGHVLNLDQIAAENILLSLDSKHLCSDECKGLCPICGADLNYEDCGCDNSDWDERFDILKDLFKN